MWGFKNGPGGAWPAKMGGVPRHGRRLGPIANFRGPTFWFAFSVRGWVGHHNDIVPTQAPRNFFWGAGGRKGVPLLVVGLGRPDPSPGGGPGAGRSREKKGGEAAFVHFMQQFTTHTNQRTQTQAPAPHPRCRRARDRPPLPSMASSTSTKVRCCFPSSAARPLFVPCEPTFLPLPMPNQPQQRRA